LSLSVCRRLFPGKVERKSFPIRLAQQQRPFFLLLAWLFFPFQAVGFTLQLFLHRLHNNHFKRKRAHAPADSAERSNHDRKKRHPVLLVPLKVETSSSRLTYTDTPGALEPLFLFRFGFSMMKSKKKKRTQINKKQTNLEITKKRNG
jgi:hypothetical protein